MTKKIDQSILQIKKFISSKRIQIYDINGLGDLLNELKLKDWIGERGTIQELIERMEPFHLFKKEVIQRSNNSRPLQYYVTGKIGDLEFLNSLSKKSFFSHATALTCHGVETLPGIIFQTIYQLADSKSLQPLSQEAIDASFKKQQRKPAHFYSWKNYRLYKLHRKINDRIGIVEHKKNSGIYFTDIEQTLLDISIRPLYAGGVEKVISAYQTLKDKVDTDKLMYYLENGNYSYPYEQAIGFYLECGGYPEQQWEAFLLKKSNYNFYLDYEIPNPVLNRKWNVFTSATLTNGN